MVQQQSDNYAECGFRMAADAMLAEGKAMTTERDCKHSQLARSCSDVCELESK